MNEPASSRPLKVAVVGHTNTGKTSLMRTLLRDVTFGEVSDRPATTRHVEGAAVLVNGRRLLELYDTPGLEDSITLLENLESHRAGRRVDGVDLIHEFLASSDAQARFTQESKALRQVLASDVALYVIDARDRVLGKHRDELDILSRCARPVVPVLNFVASPDARTAEWREHLSRANMHAVAEFDTVVLDEQGEQRLYEKMQTLLDAHRHTLAALIEDRRRERAKLIRASASLIADLLIDAAAFVLTVPQEDRQRVAEALEDLKDAIRRREQRCVEALLELHRFGAGDAEPDALPIEGGQWGTDLFSPAALKQFGVGAGGGAAAGALAGLVLDVFTAGLSLGAATALGATIGAAVGAGGSQAKRLVHRARGLAELRTDGATLRLLLLREVALVDALLRRGHASQQPLRSPRRPASTEPAAALDARLANLLDEARLRPSWSHLTRTASPPLTNDQRRRAVHDELTRLIEPLLREER